MWLTDWSEQKKWKVKVKRGRSSEVWAFFSQFFLLARGGVSGMAQSQAEGVLNLSGCGEKKWQDSLKLPSVLLMDSSVDMAGLETS